MANLVMDSSVAIKWFVVETHSDDARRVLTDYQTGAINLLAPDLLFAEIGNIVWKKHVQQGMSAADARLILDGFRKLTFQTTPAEALLDEAYRLAVRHRRAVYDALYVALSVREKCQFITADQKLFNVLVPSFPGVIWVTRWP